MPIEFVLAIVAVFISVALASVALGNAVLAWATPERRRLRELGRPQGMSGLVDTLHLTEPTRPTIERLARTVPKSPEEMWRIRRRLATAGYRNASAAVLFATAEVICPIVFALLPMLVFGFKRGFLMAILGAVFGFLAPSFWLGRKTKRRQKQIQNGLPDALDLFIVCIEAGSSLDQAIVKASEELDISHPALADELRLVNIETRAGKPRLEAFKNFAARTKVDDVRALVSMLVQTDRFGTSIAQALRTHAETSRIKRRQRAEERAHKIGVKLVFPLVFCLFPAFYVVVLGPAVIQYVRVVKQQILG